MSEDSSYYGQPESEEEQAASGEQTREVPLCNELAPHQSEEVRCTLGKGHEGSHCQVWATTKFYWPAEPPLAKPFDARAFVRTYFAELEGSDEASIKIIRPTYIEIVERAYAAGLAASEDCRHICPAPASLSEVTAEMVCKARGWSVENNLAMPGVRDALQAEADRLNALLRQPAGTKEKP